MRITAEEKLATRKRILDAAKALFRSKGFENATTRDIAKEVGVATGTLFNYFASKEAIVVEMVAIGLEKADKDFQKNRRSDADLAELLFASVAAQLRALKSVRKYIRPFVGAPESDETGAAELSAGLHEHFASLLRDQGVEEPTAVQLTILWSLYVGVLSFWSSDTSPKQEDSLALLDQSVRMYVDWLNS